MFRYWFLTIYVVVSFLKSMRHLYDHELTDPRISYTKRMQLIHEHAKRFARGCIDQSGSVMTIHQKKKLPDGPVIYVTHELNPVTTTLLIGHLEKPFAFMANSNLFRYPILKQWLKKMAVIRHNQSDEGLLEEAKERVMSGQSVLLSEKYRAIAEALAEECDCPLVPIETSGTDRLLTGKIVKRLRPVNVDIHIKAPVMISDYVQKRA
ncbi:lysophospholipid acyltransferase family protein [Bacillus zhangzhouensis]|uniref:lysophospholipid acyltransferase family protein n=1 Tax=Bacillus zhangzhouensis TaxID=1178540 RepID=UPI0020BDC790|nr:lysophospholipid acyltransferase family protein [Bacillus zhangzhouensis]MED1747811.1 lysophospholipid acyltransferase family protein [Bacillus zhangzhouensis]